MKTISLTAVIFALAIVPTGLMGQMVGGDDFDGGEMFISRTFTPDLSGNPIPGTFPGSLFDVFGIVERTVNFDFTDDTLFDETFIGLMPSTVTDRFFGSEDLTNNDNPDGSGLLVYEFDIAGATDLSFSADFAALGDFETANDIITITGSIDGGAPQLLIEFVVDEAATLTYTFESGVTADFNDPMTIQGVALNNVYQNFSAPIAGTGNVLTLTFSLESDGGGEVVAIDNVLISGGSGKVLVGDVNCDGVVNLLDVAPFVALVSSGTFDAKADINGDMVVDLLDVAPFVALVSGG